MPRKQFESYTKFALSETEVKRCLLKCDSTEKELIIRLGVFFGLRRADMAKLKRTDFDFINHELTYWEEKKNRKRTLPMDAEIEVAVRKHMNATGTETTPEYLFENPSSSTMYRRFQEILEDAEIPPPDGRTGRPFHALRGTCYKQWKKRGMPVEQVAVMLGDTVSTAMMHYGVATTSEIKDFIGVGRTN